MKSALFIVKLAWDLIDPVAIENCWRHTKILLNFNKNALVNAPEDSSNVESFMQRLTTVEQLLSFDKYI